MRDALAGPERTEGITGCQSSDVKRAASPATNGATRESATPIPLATRPAEREREPEQKSRAGRSRRGRLAFLDYAWHQAHSYRLHALPARFDYLPLTTRQWDPDIRPYPPNFGGVVESPDLGTYDVILSHLDNWCDRAELRGTPFRLMNLIAMGAPQAVRICIMHGTPDDAGNRARIHRMLDLSPGGSPFLVVNSESAYRDWQRGPERSRAIIHGYDVDEFWSAKQRKVWAITVCSAGNISRSYHGVPLLERIRRDVPVLWVGYKGDLPYFDTYQAYRQFLAESLIYVHTGQRSPMPGARTEAMLSGCCIVTTPNNDADQHIIDGETGFVCPTARSMIDTLQRLLSNPKEAYRVGKRGREYAREAFHSDRFVRDWLRLLADLGVDV